MQMFKDKDVPPILPDTWNAHIFIKEYWVNDNYFKSDDILIVV